MNKKVLSLILSILFLFSALPQSVLAEESAINHSELAVELDSEAISALLEQVRLLSLEVKKLQIKLNYVLSPNLAYEPLTLGELRETITSSIEWFKAAQEESGHFKYEYLPYENKYLPLDNVVRQAGALYALGEVALHDKENKHDLKSTLQSGISYFESLSNRGSYNGYDFKCISNSTINEMCQLGATSLALVGLIDTAARFPELEDKYSELINDYGNYLMAMKKKGSGFRHAYTGGSQPSDNESSFSNGEALLGLVRLYKYSPNEEIKKIIEESFEYFNSEEVGFDFPLYLWAMAAIKDMQELWPSSDFVSYVEDYTDWRVSGFAYRKGSAHNMCAYVEGVISARSVMENNVEKRKLDEIEREINYWLRQSKKLQISSDDEYRLLDGGEGEKYFGKIEYLSLAKGGFLTDEKELTQRIDFTQHCMNSYLQELVDVRGESL